MPALECPHCGAYANFRHEWSTHPTDDRFRETPPFACFTCDNCRFPVVGIIAYDNLARYWPTSTGDKDFPDVPKLIATAASEAHQCLAAGSPLGAVALARAVVESVAKANGITKGSLQSKIDKLSSDGHISGAMKEAAHEIRFAGNEAAHGDLLTEPLTIEDAGEIVSLMDTILERIYQEPAQVARIRQQRENRKAGQATATEEKARNGDSPVSDEPPF